MDNPNKIAKLELPKMYELLLESNFVAKEALMTVYYTNRLLSQITYICNVEGWRPRFSSTINTNEWESHDLKMLYLMIYVSNIC